MLRDDHGYTFASSSLWAAERAVRPALAASGVTYETLDECYEDRVNHRAAWYDAISAYNGGGKSRLAEEILVDHDIYVGMRAKDEYDASRDLFDHVLWVDGSARFPAEPASSMTITYNPRTMWRVDNNTSLLALRDNVARMAAML